MKIHLGKYVCNELGLIQGKAPYLEALQLIGRQSLIDAIDNVSDKREAAKEVMIKEIQLHSDEQIAVYGVGDGWFYVGHEAVQAQGKRDLINFQEDQE